MYLRSCACLAGAQFSSPSLISAASEPLHGVLNFVVHGLLEEGVAAATRQDGQAKSLGEWLRARVVDVPEALLGEIAS